MSGDRRVRRTRQAVQRALIELILDKGYDAVTVTDVINRADVGRSTFYAHFTDKQDVLFSNLDELAFLRPDPAADGPLFAFSLPMLRHAREQDRLVRALLGRRGGSAVLARGERILSEVVRRELLARGADQGMPLDLAVTCVVGAFMALLRGWADGEITATPEQLDAAFRRAAVPGAEAYLRSRPR
ncbi:MAG: TetR/AcrR family transcriptional regulator [Thermoactinospora sp.]|nr:TetR/AcrR family transcriptional regulator [Thermoactinospora sp.]